MENILLTQTQILWVSTHAIVKMFQSHADSAFKLNKSAVLFQVVIGGINVDFIAKGKTKTLQVSFIRNMIYPHWEGPGDGFNNLSPSVRPDQPRKCLSIIRWCRSQHCWCVVIWLYLCTCGLRLIASHTHAALVSSCKTLWVDWAIDPCSSQRLERTHTAMQCLTTVNIWYMCICCPLRSPIIFCFI